MNKHSTGVVDIQELRLEFEKSRRRTHGVTPVRGIDGLYPIILESQFQAFVEGWVLGQGLSSEPIALIDVGIFGTILFKHNEDMKLEVGRHLLYNKKVPSHKVRPGVTLLGPANEADKAIYSQMVAKFNQVQVINTGKHDADRDWTEDFPHENGYYMCKCCECKQGFLGHKRRVVCKLCSQTSKGESHG